MINSSYHHHHVYAGCRYIVIIFLYVCWKLWKRN